MKACPFCAAEIYSEFVTCPVCGQSLKIAEKPKPKWYYSNFIVIVAILSFGPLALPLVWFHPHYKRSTKIIISVAVIAFTAWCFILVKDLYYRLMQQAKQLGIY